MFFRLPRLHFRALAFAACLVLPVAAESELVELTDVQGRKISAKLVSSDGELVTILRKDSSSSVVIKLAQLDDASKRTVTGWVARGGNMQENFEVAVETNKNRKTDGTDDFDDKRVNLKPVVTVKNPHTKFPTLGGSLTVLILGRPVDSATDIFVFKKQEFDLPSLQPLETKTFTMAEISQAYDSRGYAKFGSRYLGYAVLVHDAGGQRIIFSRSVPVGLANEHGKKLISLKSETAYDRTLEVQPRYKGD